MSSDSSSSSVADGPPAPTPTSAPVPADLPYDQLTVSLNIISPTTTATSGGPLSFPDLSISTTISQLKEKIRNAIPSKPADTQQRLIYRGRHLQADNDTLGQIIGEATIREHSLQAFHLVLRGIPDAPAPTPSVLRGRIPTPGEARPLATQAQTQNPRQQSPLGAPTPEAARRTAGFAIPTAPNFTPQQVQQMHSQLHQSMSAWSSGLQREAVNRAMANHQINHNQSARAAMAQMLPHFWLVVRLGVFIWWFTSPNSSWSRWATVIAIAISIFIVNTGLFDAYFDRIVAPIRRHLDNLLPLANNNHNHNNNPPNNADLPGNPDDQRAPVAAQHNGPIDPAQAAARLVARRRHDNTTWLMEQARRLERAGLLFLASIAPGVAERHIAHLEEQERAERRRREEAEAAATAAAAAANGEPEPAAENAEANTGGEAAQNETPASAGPADGQQGNDQPAERREAEPLIAV
ncbi:hypothetical protein HYQ44_015273 [Verticillium longisporum]|nr:hypothetical protein HYQ44_015273 [Verticillium longisporum]